ncbi:L-rhamnose mutarotase [Galbitalea soli]|uniref:L-rhamnose mutarotase n=2 Tax=Galbitalea soli TaxID=1268042 RepID=A0A7C9PMU4_9MICO|nr:L-rhamnose mutarotase [Galbitalea soli]NEM91031.1 L-rhamnose mutarotase [Galbitalea soli]
MIARLRPERREEYFELHANVWPGVAATITQCGIRNFTIYSLGDVIVGYYEYVGDDFEADQRRMAADPVTQEWWSRTAPCQLPFEPDSGEPNWQLMTEAWHQD